METALLRFVNQTLANDVLDVLLLGVTISAQWLYPSAGVALMLSRKHRRLGVVIFIAFCITLAVTLLFQLAVARPRPNPFDVRLIYPQPNTFSYPSGHTSCALAFAVVVGLHARRLWVWLIGLGWAGLVALSRVYLGAHYPHDILGGTLLGAGLAASVYGLIVWRRMAALLFTQFAIMLLATHMAYIDILPPFLWRIPFLDKALHALLFGGAVFWLNLWLRGRTVQLGPKLHVPLAVLVIAGTATAEEILQALSPNRTFDLGDLAFDFIGLGMAWWLSQKRLNQFQKRSFHPALRSSGRGVTR